jgi:hypothetical protein
MRRLAVAVICQAATDFMESRDLRIWEDAVRFLFAENPDDRELFRQTLEASAIDARWLLAHLVRARERIAPPSGFRNCKNCGPIPISEFRDGNCKKCRSDQEGARRRRRLAGIPPKRPPRSCEEQSNPLEVQA